MNEEMTPTERESASAESADAETSAGAAKSDDASATIAADATGADGAVKKKKLSEMKFSECASGRQRFARLMNYIFIEGMSGMALGLFATLIAGTIVWQLGQLIDKGGNNFFGLALEAIGKVAQVAMGAGIGVGG